MTDAGIPLALLSAVLFGASTPFAKLLLGAVDPWMMALVGPGILTTVGAVDSIEKTKTYQMLIDRLEKRQLIKVFGAGHMSFGMGVGGKKRYVKPEDFVGRKVRSMGPVENASLASWKASPVVMGFGEVPNALESGVIDGLMTSLGGWNSVREQAPFYTMGGAGAFVGDYYMISASRRWWDRLDKPTQAALSKLIVETIHPRRVVGVHLPPADAPDVRARIEAGPLRVTLAESPGGQLATDR